MRFKCLTPKWLSLFLAQFLAKNSRYRKRIPTMSVCVCFQIYCMQMLSIKIFFVLVFIITISCVACIFFCSILMSSTHIHFISNLFSLFFPPFSLQIGPVQTITIVSNDSYPSHQIANYWMRIYVKRLVS